MEKLNKLITFLFLSILISPGIFGQSIPTMELARSTFAPYLPVTNSGFGAGINPLTATFMVDATNNGNFTVNPATITVTASLQNQTFTGLNYGSTTNNTAQTTGLVFGLGPTTGGNAFTGGSARNRWDILGAYTGSFGPTNAMFTSNPTATGAQLGTGIGVGTTEPFNNSNGAVEIFTTAYELYKNNVPITQRVLFGQLKLTFSAPVKNPVVHIAGLGGSFRYSVIGLPVNDPNSWRSTYFSTELELQTPGVTSTLMSGNAFFSVVGNNILNSNNANPNGASVNDPSVNTPPSFNEYGAASGSVRVNGVVTELVYNVYLEGGTSSQFAWGVDKSQVLSAITDPFAGDIWYVAASFDKPTQQVSGNVFIDPQTTDNNINQSFGSNNGRTNLGGLLYANLISGGVVVATTPISTNGDYLFDNVPVANGYTVQLTTNPGTVGSAPPATALPVNWTRTGQIIGTGTGTDGNTGTSRSFDVAASAIITNVNFGIRLSPCTDNKLYQNPIALTGYFGGFEVTPASGNFYPTGVNASNGPGRIYPRTPLAATDYSITANPNSFSNALSSYPALGDQYQMAIRPSASNQVVYYLVDSAGKTATNVQAYFLSGTGSNFKGWLAKSSAADVIVKIKIYDADDATKVFKDVNITITGDPGKWVSWNQAWTINYGTLNQPSLTKKIRFDVISVNGAPFSIDEICFTENAQGPVLPIRLSSFDVVKNNCTANLNWKTSGEFNSDRFEIEVSTGNNPTYSVASSVLASGSSSSTKSYQYNYPMQEGVVYYFRLKMIDKDGSFTYSTTQSASCTKGKGGIVLGPNPTTDYFTVRGMQDGANRIQVYATNGQLVANQDIKQNQGDVHIEHLAPGVYTVKVTNLVSETTVVIKLIKY